MLLLSSLVSLLSLNEKKERAGALNYWHVYKLIYSLD